PAIACRSDVSTNLMPPAVLLHYRPLMHLESAFPLAALCLRTRRERALSFCAILNPDREESCRVHPANVDQLDLSSSVLLRLAFLHRHRHGSASSLVLGLRPWLMVRFSRALE